MTHKKEYSTIHVDTLPPGFPEEHDNYPLLSADRGILVEPGYERHIRPEFQDWFTSRLTPLPRRWAYRHDKGGKRCVIETAGFFTSKGMNYYAVENTRNQLLRAAILNDNLQQNHQLLTGCEGQIDTVFKDDIPNDLRKRLLIVFSQHLANDTLPIFYLLQLYSALGMPITEDSELPAMFLEAGKTYYRMMDGRFDEKIINLTDLIPAAIQLLNIQQNHSTATRFEVIKCFREADYDFLTVDVGKQIAHNILENNKAVNNGVIVNLFGSIDLGLVLENEGVPGVNYIIPRIRDLQGPAYKTRIPLTANQLAAQIRYPADTYVICDDTLGTGESVTRYLESHKVSGGYTLFYDCYRPTLKKQQQVVPPDFGITSLYPVPSGRTRAEHTFFKSRRVAELAHALGINEKAIAEGNHAKLETRTVNGRPAIRKTFDTSLTRDPETVIQLYTQYRTELARYFTIPPQLRWPEIDGENEKIFITEERVTGQSLYDLAKKGDPDEIENAFVLITDILQKMREGMEPYHIEGKWYSHAPLSVYMNMRPEHFIFPESPYTGKAIVSESIPPWYVDFYPPRLRMNNGRLDPRSHVDADVREIGKIEYRYGDFSPLFIMFVRRICEVIPDNPELIERIATRTKIILSELSQELSQVIISEMNLQQNWIATTTSEPIRKLWELLLGHSNPYQLT